MVLDENGGIQNRNTQDIFGVNLCNDLDSKLKSKVPPEIDLVLAIHLPVENPRKYKKGLFGLIESILEKQIKGGSSLTTSVLGHKINISFVSNSPHSKKKIVGAIANDNIPHTGAKWLALLNDYWLADNETYSQAIKMISEIHDYQKILIVSDQGLVSELGNVTTFCTDRCYAVAPHSQVRDAFGLLKRQIVNISKNVKAYM